MICTFFGHHDCPDTLKSELLTAIKNVIADGVTDFIIGNHGNFDSFALSCLKEAKRQYLQINYTVVLSYVPIGKDIYINDETLIPEGIENIPKKYSIDYRNRWMIEHSEVVIAFVERSWGGAAKYVNIADRKGKK